MTRHVAWMRILRFSDKEGSVVETSHPNWILASPTAKRATVGIHVDDDVVFVVVAAVFNPDEVDFIVVVDDDNNNCSILGHDVLRMTCAVAVHAKDRKMSSSDEKQVVVRRVQQDQRDENDQNFSHADG